MNVPANVPESQGGRPVANAGAAALAADQPAFVRHAGSPWFLALTALGVVFGDIGTSPLYRVERPGHALLQPPAAAGVLGIVSLILWALMAKSFPPPAANCLNGSAGIEGGILALLSLVA